MKLQVSKDKESLMKSLEKELNKKITELLTWSDDEGNGIKTGNEGIGNFEMLERNQIIGVKTEIHKWLIWEDWVRQWKEN